MVENKKAKRVWFITDTHLGVRNNSNEWIDYIRSYFFDWFFPLVKQHWKPGDVLLHLGDYYDSRQSVNLKVLNMGVEVAEELSNLFPDGVYFIIGNHDIWGKSSNDVNSLKSIKWIPGINIFEEPETLILSDKKFFMMPWRKDHDEEENTIEGAEPHDYLCCHTDIRGLKFNRFVNIEGGTNIDKFRKFGSVYSGHIHYSQTVDNIKMLGSPYEITRSDMGNPKGITLLDLSSGDETYFPNDFSPKFKKLYFDEILDMNSLEVEEMFRNNFVDIMIDPRMALKAPLNIITDTIQSQRKLSFHPYDPEQANPLSMQIMETDGKQFNVLDFIGEYVRTIETDEDTKDKIKRSLGKLYQTVVEKDQENREL
jgi:DNA repair exonuclease SbcCD nuclease subunit